MWRLIIGAFLILHGLIHVGAASAPAPDEEEAGAFRFFMGEDRSWLFRAIGVSDAVSWWFAVGLIVLATLGFVTAGIGVFAGLSIWREIAVVSAGISLALLMLYWNRYLPVGVALNLAIMVLLLASIWPSEDLVGS